MDDRPLVVLADDATAGAALARLWVEAHDWSGWRGGVLHATGADGGTPPATPVLRAAGLLPVAPRSAVGDAREVLSAFDGADLLVVGATGSAEHRWSHLGKVPEHLLHAARLPLVIARAPRPAGVLVCVDGSPHSDAAVAAVARLPWLPGSPVTVLAVDAGDGALGPAAGRAHDALAATGAEVVVDTVAPDELTVTVNPRWTILDRIRLIGPDLVALGTHGRTGLELLWVGSVASAVVRHAPCSVLVARAEVGSRP